MYLIDSYAWVEYFKGSDKGKRASKYIEEEEISTAVITIAELSEKYEREKLNFEEDLQFILSKSRIINIDHKIALKAGKISAERKKIIKGWGMADSMVLATSLNFNLNIVTGDEHFKDLKETIMIK